MIKTLRITSIIAAILGSIFIVFPVIYGVRSDESINKFLELPSAKEKFESAADSKTEKTKSQESPLVKQAEDFAKYLNPEPTVPRTLTKGVKTPSISSKVNVTPKFPVFATIYYPENPELSQALIDEPGRGRHWVQQSSMVGHLLIEQIKDGLVVVKSSEETFELEIQQAPQPRPTGKPSAASSLKSSLKSSPASPAPKPTAFSRAASNVVRTRNAPQRTSRISADEEKMDQLVDKLKDLQQDPNSGDTDSGLDQKERNARIQELISKFKSNDVSAEESEKLDGMGEELNDNQDDPNSAELEEDDSEGKVNPPEPDEPSE